MSSTKIITKDNGMEEFKSVQAVNVLKRITVELTDIVYKDEFLKTYAKNIPKDKHDQFWAEYLMSMDAVIVRSMWGTIPHAVCDIELEAEVRSRADEDEDTLEEELCENMEVLVDRFAEYPCRDCGVVGKDCCGLADCDTNNPVRLCEKHCCGE